MRILLFLTVFGSFVALLLAQPRQCDMPPAEVQRSFAGSPFGPESNHSMIYRPLGRSGLRVSAVSYGAWLTVSNSGEVDLDRGVEILRAAIGVGINFIDNAESYGAFPGESESIMGQILEHILADGHVRRSDLVISTKLWGGGHGVNDVGLSRKHLVEGMMSSLRRLRLEYVDVVFCHRPDYTTPMEETVRAMNHLIDRGWAFYWGTSEWSAADIIHAHGIAKQLGLVGPMMEQPLYNLFNRARVETEYDSLYREHGLGLTVYSPLAEGILAGRYSHGIPENSRAATVSRKAALAKDERKIEAARSLEPIAASLNCSLAQLSLAWVLLNPHVSSAIIGASRASQVIDNAGSIACLGRLQQDSAAVERIEMAASLGPVALPLGDPRARDRVKFRGDYA